MASLNEILFSFLQASKYLGSAFKTPGTSFQIITSSALRHHAKIEAEKSEPSLPNVVVLPFLLCPMNPCIIAIF